MNAITRFVKLLPASVVLATALACPMTAMADVDVFTARIDRIGLFQPDATKSAMVQLTDLSSNPAWVGSRQFFLSRQALGTEGIAMVLTAFGMEKNLFVRVAGTAEPLSLITVIYVNAQ